jgi:DNA-binding GntR family transcriptional regulator
MARQNIEARKEPGPAHVPRYRTVYDAVRQQITSGALGVGDKLPTEDELSQKFGVSRHTIRFALRELKDEGLIRSQQGSGSIVVRQSRQLSYTSSVSSLEELLQYATEVRYEVAKSGMVVADTQLAHRLGSAAGERWLRLEGIRTKSSRDEPVCWTEVFVHANFAGVGLRIGHQAGTIYSWIEEMYGVRIGEVRQVLRVVPMPEDIAAKLGCAPDIKAVEICRSYYLEDGQLVEVAFNLHPADRFQYELTLRRRG